MRVTSNCYLCKNEKFLEKSHVIPKFVSDWLKKTSVTGKMRSANLPNKRVQDLDKKRLLCHDCEQKLSKYEKYFSENLFKPFLNANNPIIFYNENLKKFAVSILWRLLVFIYPDMNWKNNIHKIAAEKSEKIWRDYLYKNKTISDDNIYMVMLKLVPDASMIEGTMLDINWYFFRAVDGTIAQNKEEAFVYVKLPGFAFFASLYSTPLNFFKNCRILNQGSFDFNTQDVKLTIFRFLYERSRIALKPIAHISQIQREKINEDYEKYKDKIENSFGFQLYLAKELRKKK